MPWKGRGSYVGVIKGGDKACGRHGEERRSTAFFTGRGGAALKESYGGEVDLVGITGRGEGLSVTGREYKNLLGVVRKATELMSHSEG